MGVDGILSNQVYKVVKIMNRPEFESNFRKATKKDYPWTQIIDGIFYNVSAIESNDSEEILCPRQKAELRDHSMSLI